jgi:hypothetical protein
MSQRSKGETEKKKWADITRMAEEGDWDKLKELYPSVYCLHRAKLDLVNRKRKIVLTTLDGETEHEWLYGKPGTGKSRTARIENPDAYIKDPTTEWWDGYNGEETVIIDDFDKYQVSLAGFMKRALDRYPFQGAIKGGYLLMRPRKIIVTSNYTPDEIWSDEVTQMAIGRRVKLREFL